MLINHKHRYLFVHICKTGGTSIRSALLAHDAATSTSPWRRVRRWLGLDGRKVGGEPPHLSAAQIRDNLSANLYEKYFKFAFVRNPWDWQVSWYHYILENPNHHQHALVRGLRSFEKYIAWRADHEVILQKEFVTDAAGDLIVDFIGRYEHLRSDFASVCARFGIETQLPHLNRSPHGDYRSFYDRRTRALVESAWRDDIEFFNYRFEGEPRGPRYYDNSSSGQVHRFDSESIPNR